VNDQHGVIAERAAAQYLELALQHDVECDTAIANVPQKLSLQYVMLGAVRAQFVNLGVTQDGIHLRAAVVA
jgi:hypothetical protein